MSADLVGGSYPVNYSMRKFLALTSNLTQANLAVRSNLDWFGPTSLLDEAAALVTADITWAAVPVEIGDPISNITVIVGGTAATTPTHQWAGLYNATGKRLAKSVDGTSTAIGGSAAKAFSLSTTHIVNSTDAPSGWLYAGVQVTATTVPSLICIGGTVATAGQYAWFTGMPAHLTAHGSASGATAPATLPSATAEAYVPVVILR